MPLIDLEIRKPPEAPIVPPVVPVVPGSAEGNIISSARKDEKKKGQISPCIHWVFTYNNPDDNFIDLLRVVPEINKFVVQKEVGKESGIPHYQGYVAFKKKVRPCSVVDWTSKIWWEKCKDINKAIEYCQKADTRVAGPFFKNIKPWRPLQDEFIFKDWQKNLIAMLDEEPHKRKIFWYYDLIGGKGKSEIAKWLAIHKEAIIMGGKGADMKDAIARMPSYPEIIIIDVPRCSTEFVSYQGLEEVKNGCFFSGKYESKMVVGRIPHVVVFANEEPKREKLSIDRWEVIELV